MTMTKTVLTFATLALAVASAANKYSVTISEPATVAGTAIKPGTYSVVVDSGKATLSNGKTTVEVPVKVEEGKEKFNSTTVRYNTAGSMYQVQAIKVGGTKTTLTIQGPRPDAAN